MPCLYSCVQKAIMKEQESFSKSTITSSDNQLIENEENIRMSRGTYVKPMCQSIQNDSLSLIEKVSGELKENIDSLDARIHTRLDAMTHLINTRNTEQSHVKNVSSNEMRTDKEKSPTKQYVPINKTKIKNHKSTTAANSGNEETFLKERINIREKTLIIGDSIVNGVNPRGLKQNIQVITCRGKQAIDISTKLQTMNLNSFKQIIIYAGGNDAANGTPLPTVYEELLGLSKKLSKKCKTYLCTVCPRTDIEVTPVNDILKQVCEQSRPH